MKTFKALGALIAYPQDDLFQALDEVARLITAEALVGEENLSQLAGLIAELQAGDLLDAQERYVGLFDRGRALSLNLFEHRHGDSRERGSAMAHLVLLYRAHGLEAGTRELPDYLPLLCEFLSLVDLDTARTVLADAVSILEALRQNLAKRGSLYAAVPAALVALAAGAPDADAVTAILAAVPKDEDSLEAIDRAWEDEPVTFGPGDALTSCPMAAPRPHAQAFTSGGPL